MIHVTATVAPGDVVLEVKGHADFNPGNDPVCAGVSAIIQVAIIGLQQVAKAHPEHVRVRVYRKQERGESDGPDEEKRHEALAAERRP